MIQYGAQLLRECLWSAVKIAVRDAEPLLVVLQQKVGKSLNLPRAHPLTGTVQMRLHIRLLECAFKVIMRQTERRSDV